MAQRSSMEYVGPFFFNGIRSVLGGFTLIAVIFAQSRIAAFGKTSIPEKKGGAGLAGRLEGLLAGDNKTLLLGGLSCGSILFAGTNFQQVGLVFTTASKAGFITALYIVLVPIFGILLKHKTHWNTWAGVAIAAVGLYFLCINEALQVESGDMIVLVGAAFWAMHILVIAYFVARVDAVKLSCLQFFVCGILSLLCMVFFDIKFSAGLTADGFSHVLPSILYTGILSSGAGFTLQAIGQKYANPTAASIIMSTEAVFGVIGGFLLLGERLSGREVLGCVLMFAAVVLAQLPIKRAPQ